MARTRRVTMARPWHHDWSPTLIDDFRRDGSLLEIGCRKCGRHGYYDLNTMLPQLRGDVPAYLAAMFLVCRTCGATNKDHHGMPIWTRGDARQADCPAGPLPRPAIIDYEGTTDRPAFGTPLPFDGEAREIGRLWADAREREGRT